MSDKPLFVNVDEWIKENEKEFLPPVCNKLMHFRQLNIMFVGGPNTRKDYHIEEGEELFYQVRGDMCLKVVENGKHKDVHIKEGEMFLLPARIPHSPQRKANTVGLVVERRRLPAERDCLRYYVDNSPQILFERWFYCENLGTQLVPIIRELRYLPFCLQYFFCTLDYPDDDFTNPPFSMNTERVMPPFNFKKWLDTQRPILATGRHINMFGDQFETETLLYGPGWPETSKRESDVWIWQLVCAVPSELRCFLTRLFLLYRYQWQRDKGTVALFVVQNPARKRPYY
uniref:3-hydroxyanthranilate 3,4-dioxygenase n=1 Tax=Myripristis murdjan TaxID=586833 RepID=A0A667XRD4_9TELE